MCVCVCVCVCVCEYFMIFFRTNEEKKKKKETMNVEEYGERNMGGIGVRKGTGEML